MRYSCGAHTTNLYPWHNYSTPWMCLDGLCYRYKAGLMRLYVFYAVIICWSTFSHVQDNSVVWKEAGLVPYVDISVILKFNCDIGLVEMTVCCRLPRLASSVSSPKPRSLQSLCELSTLNWCCDSVYNGKLTIFCVEWKCMYIYIHTSIWIQYCIWVSKSH